MRGAGRRRRGEAGDLADEIAAMRSRLYRFACTLTNDREEALTRPRKRWSAGSGGKTGSRQERTSRRGSLPSSTTSMPITGGAIRCQRLLAIDDADVERELARPIQPVEHEVLRRAHVQDVVQALDALPREYALPLRLVAIDELS